MFDIPIVADRASTAFGYCFLRVKDAWPDAVLVGDGGAVYDLVTLAISNTTACTIFKTRDYYDSAQLFHCPVPCVRLQRVDNVLRIEGLHGAEALAETLSKLPFWNHKVTESKRLQAAQ